MNIERIDGATRVIGEAQGYLGLPLRDVLEFCAVGGLTAAMQSAWRPTPDELAAINAGANVILTVLGTAHPPVRVEVGEPATPATSASPCAAEANLAALAPSANPQTAEVPRLHQGSVERFGAVYGALAQPQTAGGGVVNDATLTAYEAWRTKMDAAGLVPAGITAFSAGFKAAALRSPPAEAGQWRPIASAPTDEQINAGRWALEYEAAKYLTFDDMPMEEIVRAVLRGVASPALTKGLTPPLGSAR